MNKLITFIIIVVIALVSCDGRERVHKSNTDILKEQKLLSSFSEKIEHIPEHYSEVIKDSVLSNGFKIKAKVFIDLKNSVMKITTINSIQNKTYYRNRIVQINVQKNDKVLFSEKINNKFIIDNTLTTSLKDYVLENVYTNYDEIYQTNKVTFTIVFQNHLTDKSKYYQVTVDESGKFAVLKNRIIEIDII